MNLYLAIIAGLQRGELPAIVHEVIWRQPFFNANHRTAAAAIQDELDVRLDEQQARLLTTDVILESKALLDGSDTSLSNEEAKRRHYGAMQRLVAAIQSIK